VDKLGHKKIIFLDAIFCLTVLWHFCDVEAKMKNAFEILSPLRGVAKLGHALA